MARMRPMGLALLLSFGGSACGPAGAVRPEAPPFEFRPGVIVEPARSVIYLMSPDGGIDAVDLATGKNIWSTSEAAKPLALHGDFLIAQAETPEKAGVLSVVGLNARGGGSKEFGAEATLPQGIRPSIDDGLGTSFLARAGTNQAGDLLVAWESSKREISGMDRGASAEPDVVEGSLRINVTTGRVETMQAHAGLPRPQLPPRHELPAVGDGFTLRYASADGRHFLASKPGGEKGREFAWAIYSLETGRRVALVHSPAVAGWFFIWGGSLIHEVRPRFEMVGGERIEEPLHIRAVDLETGTEQWVRPFRDTAYRGPYPPVAPEVAPGS